MIYGLGKGDAVTEPTNCKPCLLREADRPDEADKIESIRAQRILLALVNGAGDATLKIAQEVNYCKECTWRLSSILATMMAAQLAYFMGGTEAAAKFLEQSILEDMDGLDGRVNPM